MDYKGKVISLVFFVLALSIFLISYTFAAVEPVESVYVSSEKADYDTKEEGSFQLMKSSEWKNFEVAKLRLLVRTNAMNSGDDKDVVLVIPTSTSDRSSFSKMKDSLHMFIEDFLKDGNNRISLIFYNNQSIIASDFTNDKIELFSAINDLTFQYGRNYYYPFTDIDTVFSDYQHESGREAIVTFITSGLESTDMADTMIRYLKDRYSYLTINNIAYGYSLGSICDDYFSIDSFDTLLDQLYRAAELNLAYDHFQVVDYIDPNFVVKEKDIVVEGGSFELGFEDGRQKIIWNLDGLMSGQYANLFITLRLQSDPSGENVMLPTNSKEIVTSRINNLEEYVESTKSPILAYDYQVTYDGNAPDGCSVSNVPSPKNHAVFSTVLLSDSTPLCSGYEFKGWEVLGDDITKINDDYFIMPEKNVVVRAKWSKIDVSKSMSGKIFDGYTLYEMMKDSAVMDNISSEFVSSSTGIDFSQKASNTNGKGIYIRAGTENNKYPVMYFRGDIDNNHVKFGGFCWQIVRTTDTGGTKLIYDGVPDSSGYCNNSGDASAIGYSSFNDNFDSLSDVGYMYGNRYPYTRIDTMSEFIGKEFVFGNDVVYSNGSYTLQNTNNIYGDDIAFGIPPDMNHHYFCMDSSSSCSTVYYWIRYHTANYNLYSIPLQDGKKIEDVVEEATSKNSNQFDSTIKTYIDTWYNANMIEYTKYLEDTIWCNDRSIYDYGSFEKTSDGYLIFSGDYRFSNIFMPNLSCQNLVDSFTVSSENGNGKLTYPVALLTTDEALLAGIDSEPLPSYLSHDWSWTLTPYSFFSASSGDYGAQVYRLYDGNMVTRFNAVRPSVSLRGDLKVTSGIGTREEPYEFLLN